MSREWWKAAFVNLSCPATRRVASSFTLPLLLVAVIGCGSSSQQARPTTAGTSAPTTAGDIPDTAVYLTFHGSRYSLRYVEGWTIQLRPPTGVIISDKDSYETVVLSPRHGRLTNGASADLAHLSQTLSSFHLVFRHPVRLPAGNAVRAQYQTLSPRDSVTGKRVRVIVDRYYIDGPGKRAEVTLTTPIGVDNVDAFRLIARSFRWM